MGLSALEMIVSLVFGYLCGTIPFGLILTKSAGLGDIRSIGSGNIGATNVLRTGNKKVAALTLVLDALKGTLPALLMGWLYGPQAAVLAGLAAFFGHLFPHVAGLQGRQGCRHHHRRALRTLLAVGPDLHRGMDCDGRAVPHLLAFGSHRQLPVAASPPSWWAGAI